MMILQRLYNKGWNDQQPQQQQLLSLNNGINNRCSSSSPKNIKRRNKIELRKFMLCICIMLFICIILFQIEFLLSSPSTATTLQEPQGLVNSRSTPQEQVDDLSVKETMKQPPPPPPLQKSEEQQQTDEGNDIAHKDNSNENEDWHIVIGHEPRYDLLGSFALPTMFLLGITKKYSYDIQIFPFQGSQSESILKDLFNMKDNIPPDWGSGFHNANHRTDYDPVQLNTDVYDHLGFITSHDTNDVSVENIRDFYPWIKLKHIPKHGSEMNDVCNKHYATLSDIQRRKMIQQNTKKCFLLLTDSPVEIREDMDAFSPSNGINDFYTPEFCQNIRSTYIQHNQDRIQELVQQSHPTPLTGGTDKPTTTLHDSNNSIINATTASDDDTSIYYNVAIHIRRGDITAEYRYIQQSTFANVAKHICQMNTETKGNSNIHTNLHIFSSGPNNDGDWSLLDTLVNETICANIIYHINENEFDNWVYMIAIADALIISPSTFSYVPALIRCYHRQAQDATTKNGVSQEEVDMNNSVNGVEKVILADGSYYYHHLDVYYPSTYWHPTLSSFYIFDSKTGDVQG